MIGLRLAVRLKLGLRRASLPLGFGLAVKALHNKINIYLTSALDVRCNCFESLFAVAVRVRIRVRVEVRLQTVL